VLWNQPAQQLVIAQGLDASRAAQAFALLNVVIVDSAIACWDAMWTPPFPDYPSGHSVVGAAAARALAHSFGPRPGAFTMTGAGGRVHRYETYEEVVQEVIDARVWGGAHWRSSDTLGVEFGNRIADYVLTRRGK
jgi:hypothetical protein